MVSLEIKKFPDRVLRKRAKSVQRVGDSEKGMLRDMAEVMYLNNGVGLAAVQVGIDKQLAVVDTGKGLVKLINPMIIKKEGSDIEDEGCLSIPNAVVRIKRAKKITVNFLNDAGDLSVISADGLFARAIQHEIDHLSGKLIIDYLNPIKRLLLKRRAKVLDKILAI